MNLIINKYFLTNALCLLVTLLPIAILSGSLVINVFHILISIFFLIEIYKEKKFNFFNNYFFYLLLFLWISFLINLIFSSNPEGSLPRSIGFIRFILLIFAIKYIFIYENEKYTKFILTVWLIVFIIVTIDLLFEFYFGKNTLGFESYMPGRLASFLNDELKIGGYYLGFALISITTLYNFSEKKSYLIPIFILIFLVVSFLIGERSNFIKFFIISFFLYLFVIRISLKYKIFGIFLLLTTLFLVFNFNEDIKYRYYSQSILNFKTEVQDTKKKSSKNLIINTKDQIYKFIKNSEYGAHYNAAYKMFLAHPYFGVGIKNYRNESYKEQYKNEEYRWTEKRITTHPHQLHFEILSETGLFGYIIFFIFISTSLFLSIRNYLFYKNFYQLVAILYVASTLIPILPSGSFFTTYSATIFWINFALMITFIKNTKI